MRKVLSLLLINLGFLSACSHSPYTTSNSSSNTNMVLIAPNIFVDPAMSESQRQQFLMTAHKSRQEISNFFGGMQSSPYIYACATNSCLKKFGGIPAKAKSINDNKVILSNRGLDKVTLTHELAHVELHKRLGKPHVWNKLPMWFDEGLAVLVCKDPRYNQKVPMIPLGNLQSEKQWIKAVRESKPAYNVARQAVETWYRGTGSQGLQELLDRLKKGEKFSLGDNVNRDFQVSRL